VDSRWEEDHWNRTCLANNGEHAVVAVTVAVLVLTKENEAVEHQSFRGASCAHTALSAYCSGYWDYSDAVVAAGLGAALNTRMCVSDRVRLVVEKAQHEIGEC
jgi:hypothetical protein